MRRYCWITVIFFIFFVGCVWPTDRMNRNMASQYHAGQQDGMLSDACGFQTGDSSLRIFFKVNCQKLLFSRQQDGSFSAALRISADIMDSYESAAVLDSSSYTAQVDLADRDQYKVFHFDMRMHQQGEVLCKLHFSDENRGISEDQYFNVQLSHGNGRNSFLVTAVNGLPLFRNYVSSSDSVRLLHRDTSIKTVICRYFKRDFPLSSPPFGVDNRQPFDYRPDSIFTVVVNSGEAVSLPAKGFYHFQTDTTQKSGLTLFCFDDGYPKIVSTRQLLGPMRYLTVRSEFEAIESSASLRKAIDQFWLDRCKGSKEKSKLLIQKYYNRVQLANGLFGSYTEGWRTDRGMLYVVMGPPSTIYRTSNSETWVYGTVNNPASLNFMFIKVDNPFTDNDFSLTRSPFYETPWFRAVDVWRSGKAYNN